jgi:hypothetical protein
MFLSIFDAKKSSLDLSMLRSLLNLIDGPITAVKADGAYSGRKSHDHIRNYNAKPIIPPPRNAIVMPGNFAQNNFARK